MHKRRDIRESAVQFLYFSDLEGAADPSAMQDTFWEIIQENSLRKLNQAKAKAILHIAQGRESRMAKLSERVPLAQAEIKATGNLSPLSTSLRSLLREESKLNAALDLLRSAMQSKTGEELIPQRLSEVFTANHVVQDSRRTWQLSLEDYPAWRSKLEAITAAVSHLERISKRFDAIERLETTETPEPGTEHLHSSSQEITQFRQQTESLVQGVLTNKENLDEQLSKIVENYSPDRVDPVDRAILRIGAYEILLCDDIPRAVSINEAIEIAKRFGTTESSRFINGILDAL
ncbi:transcription antitermination factor NusB [Verrucomicrobiaceae bacterium N1E253]|uniref:Transcription antitermination protein NusB n=1 Tax=Oceaniferula marina TaxID=2748318 RepID=A0A851GHW7_9BACT|nr:transcription antitermination factor NusB [Oceaniferula marina]NWK55461.1 transcription antitermination factor NusB [Oceaniferula marina]